MAKRKRANAEGSSGPKRKTKTAAKVSAELPPPPVFPYTAEKGIPISAQKPNSELLEEPLSVKDSYALSHSLAQSRNKWLSGAMFTKFWTRPPRGRKLAEGEVNAREKMAKLCECLMAIGPHIFDVKLFIVKDDSKDDVKEEGKDDLKEDSKTGETTDNAEEKIDETDKAEGPETKEDKNKDSVSQPTEDNDENEKPKSDSTTEETVSKSEITEKSDIAKEVETNQAAPPAVSESDLTLEAPKTPSTSVEIPQITPSTSKLDVAPSAAATSSSAALVQPSAPASSESLIKPNPPASFASSNPSLSTTTDKPVQHSITPAQPQKTTQISQKQDPSSQPSQQQTHPSQPQEASATDSKTPKPSTSSTATVANNPNNMATIMKLQAIARIDRSLNSLMKIVASGNASPEQITAFQAYINRARSMELEDIPRFFKPVPDPGAPNASAALHPQQQPQANQGQNPSDLTTPGAANPTKTLKGKVKKKDPSAPRKIGKPRGKTAAKYQKKSKDGTETKKKEPSKPKNSYIPKKLQKKVTIVFEFKDNPADRYIIPKNSIIEILPTNEVLISFLLLFPEGGIAVKSANSRLPPGNVKTASTPSKSDIKKEDGVEESSNADETALDNTSENAPKLGSNGDISAIPQDPLTVQAAEEEDYSGKSTCYYPLTVTIRNMPVKSLPILERSVNKPVAVADYMEKTMAERARAKNWWVWFQIDRRDQELLGKLIQPAKPPENMFIPARVRVYKSKKKSKEDAEKKKKKGKKDDDGSVAPTIVDDESGSKSEDDVKAGEEDGEGMDVDPTSLSKDGTAEPNASESKPDATMVNVSAVLQEDSFKSEAAKLEAEVVDFDAMEH